jgi:Cu-processing system permease protein
MNRVFYALCFHELLERTRDKWVVTLSALFAVLAGAVSLYGVNADTSVVNLSGPSLVTLASLFVPLVALMLGHDSIVSERERNTLGLLLSLPVRRTEVLLAKFLGRTMALCCAVLLGLGGAVLVSSPGEQDVLLALIGPTMLLGVVFLSIGVGISCLVPRQVTSASVSVVIWFLLVFFFDLAILGLLIVSDGAIGEEVVSSLVYANPAGLYRVEMMSYFLGSNASQVFTEGMVLPSRLVRGCIWIGWILLPLCLGGYTLNRLRSIR